MNCSLRILLVRGLLLLVAAIPAWRTEHALAAGLDDKGAGELQEAKRLYKSGKYEQASEIFSRLSAAHPDFPIFARNAGACYYYLQRADPAIAKLRDYLLTQRRIAPEDRTEVEGWISEMENLRDQNAPLPSPPVGSVLTPTTPSASGYDYSPGYPATSATDPTRIVAPVPAQSASRGQIPSYGAQPQGYSLPTGPQPAPPPPNGYGYGQASPPASVPTPQPYPSRILSSSYPHPSQIEGPPVAADAAPDARHQREAKSNVKAWIAGGFGVALLVTGGVFTYRSQSAFSDTVNQYDAERDRSGKDYALIAAGCYGFGAASAVTAAILVLVGDHHASSSIALAPVIRSDTAGAVVRYAY